MTWCEPEPHGLPGFSPLPLPLPPAGLEFSFPSWRNTAERGGEEWNKRDKRKKTKTGGRQIKETNKKKYEEGAENEELISPPRCISLLRMYIIDSFRDGFGRENVFPQGEAFKAFPGGKMICCVTSDDGTEDGGRTRRTE